MKKTFEKDDVVLMLICFIVSLVFYGSNTNEGMVGSKLDMLWLLFGFLLPYMIGFGMILYKRRYKKWFISR